MADRRTEIEHTYASGCAAAVSCGRPRNRHVRWRPAGGARKEHASPLENNKLRPYFCD